MKSDWKAVVEANFSYRLLFKIHALMFIIMFVIKCDDILLNFNFLFILGFLTLIVSLMSWFLVRLNIKTLVNSSCSREVQILKDAKMTTFILPTGKKYKIGNALTKEGEHYVCIRFPFSLIYYYSYYPKKLR